MPITEIKPKKRMSAEDTTYLQEMDGFAAEEEAWVGIKSKGLLKPTQYPGWFPVNPLKYLPRTGDCIAINETYKEPDSQIDPYWAKKKRPRRVTVPTRADFFNVESIKLHMGELLNLNNRNPSVTEAKAIYADHGYSNIVKDGSILYRKIPLYIPEWASNPLKVVYAFTHCGDEYVTKEGDLISNLYVETQDGGPLSHISYDAADDLSRGPGTVSIAPNSGLVGLTSHEIKDILNEKLCVTTCHLYRPTAIGPYGFARRLPLNRNFCEPLPLV